jgi:hypothetical protein
MKTAKKITGGMLVAAKSAEASLAQQEAKELESGLPPGHPLRDEVEKQKALVGDLSGLPPGHPLLNALQAARERYDQQQKIRKTEQDKTAEVRKAKKVDEIKTRDAARRLEEEQADYRKNAAKELNSGILKILDAVKDLYGVVAKHEEIFNIDPIGRTDVGRLKRLLFASERGLSECKIGRY